MQASALWTLQQWQKWILIFPIALWHIITDTYILKASTFIFQNLKGNFSQENPTFNNPSFQHVFIKQYDIFLNVFFFFSFYPNT